MAASTDVRLQLISESEEEEEIFVPLAERLRRKLLVARPSTIAPSFTRIQTKSGRKSPGHNRLPVSDEELVPTCWQEPLPADSDLQENVAPSAWELSDSDQETSTRHNHQDLDKVCQAVLQKSKEQGGQKQLQEREKQRKVALAQLRKAQRPEQCLKHIQIVLDPGLLQINGADEILVALQSMESNYAIESQAVPCSITWRRKTGLTEAEEDNWIEEPNVLVPMLLPDFIAMIHNSKQAKLEGPIETLQSFVAKITEKIPGKTLSLAVTELEKHFSSQKPKSQKKLQQAEQSSSKAQEEGKPRKRKEKTNPVSQLSRLDVEEALVELQLHTGVQVQVLASWKEFGEFASMFTKAVAEAPFKKEKNKTSFSFCLEGDWCRGVKVDRAGKGLLQVWKRQIQQYNRVSLEMASAIVARYPSPQLLMQAYDSHASEQERQHLLAEVPVRRGDGVTTTTRRVGPDLSKRIYLQMTSHNPDLSLDVTG
ncbi:crossover junction endonuclease EME1 [Crotalus adamanteus]|uniref:Crossover junction endonuclease EME1 n=1 Tax=Crotalus adamanteus TaxID=8729 RepID=A0AAW1BXZ1_CROAD